MDQLCQPDESRDSALATMQIVGGFILLLPVANLFLENVKESQVIFEATRVFQQKILSTFQFHGIGHHRILCYYASMVKKDLGQWATIYRGLGNPNRLKILKLLSGREKMAVSELSEELGISLKNTSRNLGILLNLDLVQNEGKHDRVYYSINPRLSEDLKRILKITL